MYTFKHKNTYKAIPRLFNDQCVKGSYNIYTIWMKIVEVSSYYSGGKVLSSLYFLMLVSVVQPHIVTPYSSFECVYDLYTLTHLSLNKMAAIPQTTF